MRRKKSKAKTKVMVDIILMQEMSPWGRVVEHAICSSFNLWLVRWRNWMRHVHSRERFSSPPPDSNSSRNCSRLACHVGDAADNPSAYNQGWVSVRRWWDWCHRRRRAWLVVHGLYWTNERHVDTWTRTRHNRWRTEHWLERSDLCRSTCCLCDHSRWSFVDWHRRTNDRRLEREETWSWRSPFDGYVL